MRKWRKRRRRCNDDQEHALEPPPASAESVIRLTTDVIGLDSGCLHLRGAPWCCSFQT